MTTLLSSLTISGKKGITYTASDPKLAAIRTEIRRLRTEGYQISETLVKSEKHSINERKQIRFILEREIV